MKVEIKEINKERQDGWYEVTLNTITFPAEYNNKQWWLTGRGVPFDDDYFEEISENPLWLNKEKLNGSEPEFKPFSPFKLELIIESKEELQELHKQLNTGGLTYYKFWNILDEIIEKTKY